MVTVSEVRVVIVLTNYGMVFIILGVFFIVIAILILAFFLIPQTFANIVGLVILRRPDV